MRPLCWCKSDRRAPFRVLMTAHSRHDHTDIEWSVEAYSDDHEAGDSSYVREFQEWTKNMFEAVDELSADGATSTSAVGTSADTGSVVPPTKVIRTSGGKKGDKDVFDPLPYLSRDDEGRYVLPTAERIKQDKLVVKEVGSIIRQFLNGEYSTC